MRSAFAIAVAMSMTAAGGLAWAQNAPAPTAAPAPAAAAAAPTPAAAAAPAPAAAPAIEQAKCANPNALGVERTVQIDTTGGPGFGFQNFKAYDFLRDKEVVLTFDDGPWPGNTDRVLKALADQCTKAMFFAIGEHAGWHPEILKRVAAAGHTIGTHTWSHKDLTKMTFDDAKAEIEKGIAAVSIALGNKPVNPFFRFPALRNPPDIVKYLGTRNVAIFSTDSDSFDFKIHKPDQVVKSVMSKLAKNGKGIILMHDFQHATSEAAPELLKQLKAGGYKIVQVVGKTPIEPLPEYKEIVLKEMGGGLDEARPMSSVIQTIQGN
ncbi:MAG TPA: polysaccharide deacetylase family protein [Pseudolabrys sp.]